VLDNSKKKSDWRQAVKRRQDTKKNTRNTTVTADKARRVQIHKNRRKESGRKKTNTLNGNSIKGVRNVNRRSTIFVEDDGVLCRLHQQKHIKMVHTEYRAGSVNHLGMSPQTESRMDEQLILLLKY
jgi:hypothetical protein